jgi:hypothetical protein
MAGVNMSQTVIVMRVMLAVVPIAFVVVAFGSAAETTAKWEERPFLPRKPGQKVAPPAFFATTKVMPAGAEVKIKVVQCPKDASLDVHRFLGGPVFSAGSTKYAGLAAKKRLTHQLNKEMKVGITTSVGSEQGRCKSIDRKEGYDVLTYSFDKLADLIIEVEVVGM